jgi:ribonuclease HII
LVKLLKSKSVELSNCGSDAFMEFISHDDKLLALENIKWDEGFSFVAGVDEVGRGPLAGPVVAAAVVFPPGSKIPKVNDSKKLTAARRDELRQAIIEVPGVQYAIAEVSPETVDRINILRASHLAMRQAVEQLAQVDFLLVDGLPVPDLPVANLAIIKGDSKSASIAAASILAKEYRDELMIKMAVDFPEYGFERHKGYGTQVHLKALEKFGICNIHRKSFAPVRNIIDPPPEQLELF